MLRILPRVLYTYIIYHKVTQVVENLAGRMPSFIDFLLHLHYEVYNVGYNS